MYNKSHNKACHGNSNFKISTINIKNRTFQTTHCFLTITVSHTAPLSYYCYFLRSRIVTVCLNVVNIKLTTEILFSLSSLTSLFASQWQRGLDFKQTCLNRQKIYCLVDFKRKTLNVV